MIRRFAALFSLVAMAAGCSSSTVTVDVFAASSLTDAFTELEEKFEAENPDIDIRLNLAGSDTLRRQIDDGANAHVFAPASIELFDGLEATPIPYATNQLQMITINDPEVVLRVLANDFDGLLVARCADGVPCGTATDQLVTAFGIDLSGATVTAESDVRAVLAKVALGEADIGFVYRTDAFAAGEDVTTTGMTSLDASVVLALAPIDPDNTEAQAFVDFVIAQQALFSSLGFGPAP